MASVQPSADEIGPRVSATGASYYYPTDHPANVVRLDATGQVVNEYEYDPWGMETVLADSVQQPLRYAREWDATVSLYPVRARWYDPHTGRFVSEDPIGLAGGDQPVPIRGKQPHQRDGPVWSV